MSKFHILRITLIVYVLTISLNLFSNNIHFQHLEVKDGLSQNSVSSIYQDSLQRMWFGTRDGINIYDGNTFKTIRPSRGDSTTLMDHFITNIIPDDSLLWVVSKTGLSQLDIQTLKINQFAIKDCKCVTRYQGEILIGNNDGLFRLNTSTKKISRANDLFKYKTVIHNIHADKEGSLLISSEIGAFIHNIETGSTKQLISSNTTHIKIDSKKQAWIGTYTDGVYLFDKDYTQIKHFKHSEEKDSSISNNNIRDIEEDRDGNIWIGTFDGLNIINPSTFSISIFRHNNKESTSLSHNSILDIYRDQNDAMWIGTYFGGINYYNINSSIFKTYQVSNKNLDTNLGFNIVGEIIEDNDQNLWIASEGKGVDFYDRKTRRFKHYPNILNGERQINVKALALTDDDNLLIGTHLFGLIIMDIKTGKTESVNALGNDIIEDIIPYGDKFLLATNKGVVLYNHQERIFSNFVKDFPKRVTCLLEDSFGTLWIGTLGQGLYEYNIENKTLKLHSSSPNDLSTISSNNISCIYEDHYFRLLIGTHGGGLNIYDRETDTFFSNNLEESSSENFIQGIVKSRYGSNWILTNNSISLLEINNNRFNFSKPYKLPLSELNHRALKVCKNGEVFIGSINGLISFDEGILLHKTPNHNLILSSIDINGRNTTPSNASHILKKDLPYMSEINLADNENIITIHYSACNYTKYNKSSFRYKLENLHDEWIYSNNKQNITYYKLSPKKYNLIVQTLSHDGQTVLDQTELAINIASPFYLSWYAYIIYILLVSFIIYSIISAYKNRLNMLHHLANEQKEKQNIQQLTQSKLNFFTNISHEFRTPLTLINSALEVINDSKHTSSENKPLITRAIANTQKLNNLIDELLDFRKIESGSASLKIKKVEISKYIYDIFDSFSDHAFKRNINFKLYNIDESYIWIDPTQIEKVFNNLISNAFKFVIPQQGKIEIKLLETKDHITISIKDNGIGLDTENIESIFNLYYQVDQKDNPNPSIGSGVGLALSKNIIEEHKGDIEVISSKGEGACFIVRLKKGKEHLSHFSISDEMSNYTVKAKNFDFMLDSETKTDETKVLKKDVPTILVVEDNNEISELIVSIFSSSMNTLVAANGKEGIELATSNKVDIIISDLMMPIMSGDEMCNILKRNIKTAHIPIIMISAKADNQSQIDGLEIGADDYITKPFNIRMLEIRVRNIILNRQHLKRRYKIDTDIAISEPITSATDKAIINKAEDIIYKNLGNFDFNIYEFASEMNMSRSNLHNKIKSVLGQTPNDLILSIRLKRAADLILQSDKVYISEIAYQVGYSDPKYFSKSFKKHFGVSPKDYKK